jgi:TonB-dependent SusC/RagA subfamily outer membrane receptor
MKKSKTLLLILLLIVSFAQGQNKLTGIVTNGMNHPIANASIFLDSVSAKATTNKKGEFEVLVPTATKVINVYSAEYGLLSSAYHNESAMNFMFLETVKIKNNGNNDISLGYSKEEDQYKVLTKQSINVEKDKNTASFITIYDLIRGRLSGVSVTRDNKITIRGTSSIRNIGDPLFVIDGMIVSSIDFISPNNVKTIRVLKGAEASIYGAQGTNGVLVITTKK